MVSETETEGRERSAPDAPLLAQLNPEQRAAVTLPPEHALILAGAGSGKTRVLTTRIAWLLQTGQVSPGGVLAVTFTNKAAREMMTRLSALLPVNVRGMWIGTFHGLCNRFLRAHYRIANLPSTFQILDTQDQLSAIKRLMKQYNVDYERHPAKELAWFIAGCKEDGLRPAMVEARDELTRRRVELYELYEEQCQREGVVDFGELMLRSYELLQGNDPLREHYRRRFRHVLVDEFQDTNRLQYAWLKMFVPLPGEVAAAAGGALFAVGDDDQSIYAFRGARVGNMADFVREYRVTHQIKLEQNYRSYGNILDAANELISHNRQRLGKNLRTDQGAGEPVRVVEAVSDFAEAQWLVDEVRQLLRDQGTTPAIARREIAVLYRSNAQSRVIETALFNAGVPYRVYGGLRFFERAEVKHALAYLRLLENPRDDTSFLRVVNFPPRGIGARTLEQLQDAARAAGGSLHDAASNVPGKAGANLRAFIASIDVLREQTQGKTLREIIELVLDASGLIEHYRSEREGADRIENLEELVNAAESFVTQEGFGRDAVALRLDEQRAALVQSPASQALSTNEIQPAEAAEPAFAEDTVSPLLAVVSVLKPRSVKCVCCARPVFRRVHLTSEGETTVPYGSSCFTERYGKDFLPRYTDAEGRELDDVRSDLLHDDIDELVDWIKEQYLENRDQRRAVAPPPPQLPAKPALGWPAPVDIPTGETLSPLTAFLTHAALESGDNQAQAGQDAVQLMTVHSAKGLEFDAVFISGLEEGLFPHENSLSDYQGLEEERRLMYVAITRARKRLYLSFAQTRLLHGQTRYHLRSRFFDELPEATLKWLTPKQPGFGTGFAINNRAQSEGPIFASGRFDRNFERAGMNAGTAPSPNAASTHGLRSGMQVFHTKFGEGTVITLEGQGDDARAQVKFARHGIKWLALSVAKLVPV